MYDLSKTLINLLLNNNAKVASTFTTRSLKRTQLDSYAVLSTSMRKEMKWKEEEKMI
jgi:hypothetical protein